MSSNQKSDFWYYVIESFAASLNVKADPVLSIPPGKFELPFCIEAINVDFRDGRSIQSRDGYTRVMGVTYSKAIHGLYPFYVGDTRNLLILTWDGTNFILFDGLDTIDSGTRSSIYFHPCTYDDLCFIPHLGNDDSEDYNLKYDGNSTTKVTKLGIDAPVTACAGAAAAAGADIYAINDSRGFLYRLDTTNDELVLIDQAFGASRPANAITCVVVSSNVIYAGDVWGQLWKYDGSGDWECVAPALGGEGILSLCVHGGEIYAGTDTSGKLYQYDSTNHVWVEVAPQSGSETAIYSLCVHDDGGGNDLYGGSYPSGKLLQWNGSDAWVEVAPQLSSQTTINCLCVHNDGGGNRLYGGTNGGKLFQWNNSDAWAEKAAAYSGAGDIYSLAVHNDSGEGGNRLFGGTITGMLLRYNNSNAWQLAAAAFSSELKIYSLLDSTSLYGATGTSGKVLKWTDGAGGGAAGSWSDETSNGDAEGGLVSLVTLTVAGQLTGTYNYYYSYYNSNTGHESALSPISLDVEPSAQVVNLTEIADSEDSQVTNKRIYRTGGNLSTINYLGEIGSTVTTYTDNIAEAAVGNPEDCSQNKVLAAVRGFAIHHHQLFGWYQDSYKGYVFDSRFYLPEAFPTTFYHRVGNATDYIMAVRPLDIDIMVYTKYHTYRLRYIGTSEGDVVLEEVAKVGLASDNTLCSGVDQNGKEFHIFLGQSAKARGIYINDGNRVVCISQWIEPIFNGERESDGIFSIAPIDAISPINWDDYINTACAAFGNNKYYLAVPLGSDEVPKHILVCDFNFNPPFFHKITLGDSDDSVNAMCYDVIADQLIFGGNIKQVYKFSGTTDYVDGDTAGVSMVYQTPYFGQRDQYAQMKEITFHANTQGETLTVKIYADFSLKATHTPTATTSMQRICIPVESDVIGKIFSIRFEITGSTTANKRLKISPPLVVKLAPWSKR